MKFDVRTMTVSAVGISLALTLAIGVRAATTSATKYAGAEGAIAFNNTSTTGSAVEGTVSASGQPSIKIPFGVLGEYEASTSTFGIGLAGVSTTGYGVAAEALGGQPAMIGIADGSGGAMQLSSAGTGMQVQTYNGSGVVVSAGGSATAVTTTSVEATTVVGETQRGDTGQFQSLNSNGGQPFGGTATLGLANGIGAAAYGNSQSSAYSALAATSENAGDIFDGVQNEGDTKFSIAGTTVNKSGNAPAFGSDVAIEGDVYVHGVFYLCAGYSCSSILSSGARNAEIATRNGPVGTYAAAQSEPTVEDTGEARMSADISYVPLDPSYTKMISSATPYLVFLTPEGETRGLYVASRSRNGFTVREHGGGRSTLAFTYRIVARPSGPQVARFAPAEAIHSPLFGRAAFPRHHRALVPPPARIATLELR